MFQFSRPFVNLIAKRNEILQGDSQLLVDELHQANRIFDGGKPGSTQKMLKSTIIHHK